MRAEIACPQQVVPDADAFAAAFAGVPVSLRGPRLAVDVVPAELWQHFDRRSVGPQALDLSFLPRSLMDELAFCVWRTIELGGVVRLGQLSTLARSLGDAIADGQLHGGPASLMVLSPEQWDRVITRAWVRRRGRLPGARQAQVGRSFLRRCYALVSLAHDPRPWWQREVWTPRLDARIPLREHEPMARTAITWTAIQTGWLRRAGQLWLRHQLETGAWRWSSACACAGWLRPLDGFLRDRGIDEPHLCDDPAGLRPLALDYLGYLRARRRRVGEVDERGQPLSGISIVHAQMTLAHLYAFLYDERALVATTLGDPRFGRLSSEHARLWQPGDRARQHRRRAYDERDLLDEATMSALMRDVERLAQPVVEGGLGDPQAMRLLMLLATTGRRISELRMLDFDPLLPLHHATVDEDSNGDGLVAKLRYQQTKIDGAPDTILIDADTVAVIRAQQQWALEEMRRRGHGRAPKYLFIAARMGRHGDVPYNEGTLRDRLRVYAQLIDLRDRDGRPITLSRTHRFRHTRATSLINAGVPLHVVQRHFGHLSPTMTMHYAQTLQETHEREFLRFKKLGADGRELDVDPKDLYDLLALDQRADRILPNGLCLLPPRQTCSKGNACLTCDKFATDASYRDEHAQHHLRLVELIETRQRAVTERTGRPMSSENVWLRERLREKTALEQLLTALERPQLADGHQAVRGAGVSARHPEPVTDQAAAG